MIKFQLTDINDHIDLGFGVTAEAFLRSAKFLDNSNEYKEDMRQQVDMPILFLYRHSIELFLKSLVLTFYSELQLPYGENNITDNYSPDKFEIYISKEKKWLHFDKIHDINLLFAALINVLLDAKEKLKERVPGITWKLRPESTSWITIIDNYDRNGQYFRYPFTKDRVKDKKKFSVQKMKKHDFQKLFVQSGQMSLLLKNSNGEIVEGYMHKGSDLKGVFNALRSLSDSLLNFYLMTRFELLKGW